MGLAPNNADSNGTSSIKWALNHKEEHQKGDQQIVPQRGDFDHRQELLKKVLNSYLNKGSDPDEFLEWCSTPKGENTLRGVYKHAFQDVYRSYQGRVSEPIGTTPEGDPLWPSVTSFGPDSFESSSLFVEESQRTSTDIDYLNAQLEASDEIRTLYENGTRDQREALEILVEWEFRKRMGESCDHLRKRLSRLRKRIQRDHPDWTLNAAFL